MPARRWPQLPRPSGPPGSPCSGGIDGRALVRAPSSAEALADRLADVDFTAARALGRFRSASTHLASSSSSCLGDFATPWASPIRPNAEVGVGTLGVVVPYSIRLFGDPVLKQRAKDVTEIDGDLVRVDRDDGRDDVRRAGVGLAAPQVGIQKRFFTYDVDDDPGVLINPEIVDDPGEWAYDEGCLSVPGPPLRDRAAAIVTVRGLDLDGNEVIVEGDELMGRMLQHEIDHLDGVLLLDRLEPEVRREAMRELRQRDAGGGLGRRRRPPRL